MSVVEVYKTKRRDIFKRVEETPVVYKLSLAFLFACLTGAGAMLRFHVPFTPVPVTLQVFFVLFSGAVLGKTYGGLSQGIYIGLGFVGIPWFTTSAALLGVTGGYIVIDDYGALSGCRRAVDEFLAKYDIEAKLIQANWTIHYFIKPSRSSTARPK